MGANTCCFRRFTGQVLCLHLLLHSENVEKKDTQCADFLHEFRSKMGISWAKNEKKVGLENEGHFEDVFQITAVCLKIKPVRSLS